VLHPNWADLYEAVTALDPDAEAIVQGDRRITWGEFDDTAARLAAVFERWGIEPGARLALLLFNGPEYLELAYGAFKARAVPTNVNFRYQTEEIRYLLADSGADVLVFHGSLAERVAGLGDDTPGHLVQIADGDAPLLDGAEWYHDLVESAEPAPPVQRSGDDLLILYTGGTTGMPKGVMWRHGDLFQTLGFPAYTAAGMDIPATADGVAEAAATLRSSGASPVMISAPPLIHGTALFLAMAAFLRGGKVVLLESRRFDAHELWRLVERERVTDLAIVGDPFARPMVDALEERDEAGEPVDLSSVRVISSAGITWSQSTKSAFRRRGQMMMLDMLGASEGGPFATNMTLPGQEPADTATFTIAERAVVLDDDGSIIPSGSGRFGVLAVKGSGPIGYFNDPVKTAATFREIDGERYVVPGDYAAVADDGTVTFVGRGSVCINTGGEKVFPEEVEEVLKTHPAVVDCNVVGVPDDRFGEAVTAVVQLTPGAGDVTDDVLVEHVKARLAGYKQPRHIVRVPELVRSPTGKSDYRLARTTAVEALGLG
jgi:3-oxocholest-4-en-26-oate---CoA ligase